MEFPLATAVIGFGIGYWCSLRLNDRNAPLVIGVCGAIVCYLAAWMLLRILVVVVPIVIVFWLYPRVWPTVHETWWRLASSPAHFSSDGDKGRRWWMLSGISVVALPVSMQKSSRWNRVH